MSQEITPRCETTLAVLIEQLAAGVERLDQTFARHLAQALHGWAHHLELPVLERLGLVDLVVTFSMSRRMKLVATGRLRDSPGEVTVSWAEGDFAELAVRLTEAPREAPYTIATLDFSVQGTAAVLLEAAHPLPAGLEVTLDALATIGPRTEYRVRAHGLKATVRSEGLRILEPSTSG